MKKTLIGFAAVALLAISAPAFAFPGGQGTDHFAPGSIGQGGTALGAGSSGVFNHNGHQITITTPGNPGAIGGNLFNNLFKSPKQPGGNPGSTNNGKSPKME